MRAVTDEQGEETPASAGRGSLENDLLTALFLRLSLGDDAALEELYDAAARPLFGLALFRTGSREDANDIVQEVFLRLARGKVSLAKVTDARAWLLATTVNAAVDLSRRRKTRAAERIGDVPFLAAPESDPGRAVDASRASRLLGALPARQRESIFLRVFAGCSFAEIGDATGVPTFTAASRYRLGIAKLRRLMETKR
jgi:RNA polymerase sigma-70 factor, ECF subfamily